MIARISTAVGLTLLTALSIARIVRTPTPLATTVADTLFSADRAMRHVQEIAQRPHPMGTPEHDRVRDYIVARLGALGIASEIQATTAIGTRYQEAGRVENILGYVPGSVPNGKIVLLVVHYDGVEAGPAAADDGAGVAALLETLRALRARTTPLRNDVVALFTDGEESGLLGAAAFVREHPRAKDLAVALNFEARGTTGRSYMFETGPGNLDVVRTLREARDVTAGSVFTTVYRTLPNDTDLSELAVLGRPAMNFAFTGGVERYHTAHDDVAHLNRGSVQHHGLQMLALTRAFGDETLPRPKTGDAVFFDAPLLGLVVYPMWVAMALGLVLIGLLVTVMAEGAVLQQALTGAATMLITVVICGAAAVMVRLSGPAMWSGTYAASLVAATIGVNAAVCLSLDRRRAGASRSGALLVWGTLAAALSFALPAVSYPFVWPTLFALVAARSKRIAAEWASALVALMMLAGFAYAVSVVMLGVAGAGAIALVVLSSMLVWLLAPLVTLVFGDRRIALGSMLPLALVVLLVARATVTQTGDYPAHSSIIYAQNAENGTAFLGSTSPREAWTRRVLGDISRGPSWTTHLGTASQSLYGHTVASANVAGPSMSLVSDSTVGATRRLTVRLDAPRGATAAVVRATGASIGEAAIDGRIVDTSRFRRRSATWFAEYWNVPPDGALFTFSIDAGALLTLEVAARRPGLPATVQLAPRPDNVVASQVGDASVVYHTFRF